MIEQQGQVISVTGGLAAVRLGGRSGCPACDSGRGCGAGVFGRMLSRRPVVLQLPDNIESRVGSVVVVGLPETLFLRLVARLYGVPLLAGLVGAALGHYISVIKGWTAQPADLATFAGALAGGGAGLLWVRRGENEFNGTSAVHLLRHADRSKQRSCADTGPDTKQYD